MRKKYSKEEVTESTLKYFNNDELATNVFITKYCLKDGDGDFVELNPNDMHRRLASEFSKIELKKYNSKTKIQPLSEAEIFNLFKDFKYIIPQGSPMFAIGNDYQLTSTSNCYVLTSPEDSYGSIMHTDEELVQVSKRRGGVGIDLSKLRPKGTPTRNAAKTSTGLISFLERYSNSIREVGQDGRRGAALLSLSCFSKDTIILTDRGELPILRIYDIIEAGEEIFAIDENGEKHLISNFIKREKEPIYKIETEEGTFIETTADHQFVVKNINTNKTYLKRIDEIDTEIEFLEIIEKD